MALPRPRLSPRPVILAVWLIAAVALAIPAAASAGPRAEVSIMDDQLLLGASQEEVDTNMAVFRSLGVDRLRVSAFWNQIAPDEESRVRPPGFDAADPAEPRYRFAGLDRVIESAARHGLKIMVTISTPSPVWASREPRRDSKLWKPQPAEFGAFAAAVVGRYAPFVDHWGASNEPNNDSWLQPQRDAVGAVAPHVYRSLVQASYPRIKALDPESVVLVGELAASGLEERGDNVRLLRPLRFLRALACRDSRYRPIRRGRCRNFRPVPMDAVGHHPYQLLLAPKLRSANKDDAAINDGRRLLRVVDRLTRLGAFVPGDGERLDLYYTEFGYQTSPPDPFAGVSLSQQKAYLQQAAFIAWSTPRVREINQFRLTDGILSGRGPQRFAEFQSGLLFRDRRAKPANAIFPHPFVISGSRFWGHVRPGGSHSVRVEHRSRSRGAFRTVAQVLTNSRGYFNFRLPGRRPGQYRYLYSDLRAKSGIVSVRR